MTRKPVVTFIIVCVLAIAGLAAYLFHAARRSSQIAAPRAVESAGPPAPATPTPAPEISAPAGQSAQSPGTVASAAGPAPAPESQRIFFRHNGVDSHYGSVGWLDTDNMANVHYVDSLHCEVVHVSGGHGICLSANRGILTTYAATLFDANTFKTTGTFELKGIPSRTRVSIDGKLAALTVFVSGHGYTALDFSTQTLLVDIARAEALADIESFSVTRDGAPLANPDFNFWGVTFTPDAKNFYATLSTGGQHYLVHGDIAAKTAAVIHANVECPSLSPDARRIAYKKRLMVDNQIFWQLHVLDLASGRETALSEKRSIDDQLEWLDNRHVLYSVPSKDDNSSPSTDVWQVPVDGRTAQKQFRRNAYSPATARGMTH